jgi:hemolysin activation/secretion protein
MKIFWRYILIATIFTASVWSAIVPPTNIKDADKILETIKPSILELKPKVSDKAQIYIEKKKALKREGDQKFFVKRFEFIGNTMIGDDDLTEVIVNEAGKSLTFTEIDAIVNKITEFYQANGYISSYAFLPAQEIDRGVVIIELFEGKLGEINVVDMNESSRDISKLLVNNSLYAKMRPGAVLNGQLLEERILLINDTPGFSAVSFIKAGKNKGESDLTVAVSEKISMGTSLSFDNYNAQNRIIVPAGKDIAMNMIGSTYFVNLFGVGDNLSFFTLPKKNGTTFYRGSLAVPINNDLDRVSVSVSTMSYRPEDEISKTWGVNGSSRSISLSYNMPIIRQTTENMNLSLSTSYSNNIDKYDEVCNIDPNDPLCHKEKTSYSVSAGLSYAKNELLAKDSSTSFGATVTVGDAKLDKIQMVVDQAENGPHITGTFVKLNITASHSQAIDTNFSWSTYANTQWSSKNNDGKFSITGPSAVQAYPSGDRSGDDGVLSGVSLSYAGTATDFFINSFQLSTFFDFGAIRAKKDFYSADSKNVESMSAVGLGFNAILYGGIGIKSSVATRVFGPIPNSGGTNRFKFWTQIFKSFQI